MPAFAGARPFTYGEALGVGIYEDNNAGLEKFTQEIRLASPSSDKLEWQVGGYYTHEAASCTNI